MKKICVLCISLVRFSFLVFSYGAFAASDGESYLEIRNVDLSAEYAEYDLYFVYDESYVIQEGKTLGIRIHEYGSTYSFSATSLTEGRRTSSAGYGNGGSSTVFYVTGDELAGGTELGIARVRWVPGAQSVTQTRAEWSYVLVNFGDGEYAVTAVGFSQEQPITLAMFPCRVIQLRHMTEMSRSMVR